MLRQYLGAVLGSLLGTIMGVFFAVTGEGAGGLRLSEEDLTPVLFWSVLGSALLISVVVVFVRKKDEDGFWITLGVCVLGGMFYPFFLWWLYIVGILFVLLPLLLLWQMKWWVLLALGLAWPAWFLRQSFRS